MFWCWAKQIPSIFFFYSNFHLDWETLPSTFHYPLRLFISLTIFLSCIRTSWNTWDGRGPLKSFLTLSSKKHLTRKLNTMHQGRQGQMSWRPSPAQQAIMVCLKDAMIWSLTWDLSDQNINFSVWLPSCPGSEPASPGAALPEKRAVYAHIHTGLCINN